MFPILHAEETDTQLHTNVEPWNEVDLGRKEKVKMKMKIQNGDKEEKRKYIKRYRNCSRKMEEPSVSLQKEQGQCMMTRRAPYSMQAEWLAEPRSLRFGSRGIICMASWWTDWVKARWLHRRRGLIYLSIYLSTYLSILPLQYSIHACSVGTLYRIPFLGTPYILANFLRVVNDGRFRGFSSFLQRPLDPPGGRFSFLFFLF